MQCEPDDGRVAGKTYQCVCYGLNKVKPETVFQKARRMDGSPDRKIN
jgi:hypothetical protein